MKTCLIFGGKKYRVNLGGEVLTIMNEWPQWSLPQIPTVGLTYEISADGTYAICTGLGTATDNNIRIASRYNGLPVTHIANSAFENCDTLTSITIPSSITTIGQYAFDNCDSLTNITVAESNATYKSIDGNLYIQDGPLLIISNYAIGKTDEEFIFPDNVVLISVGAFSGCDSLTSLTIPDSVSKIYAKAFYDCNNLSNVIIGNGVESIGNEAFYNCSNLTNIVIPNSVTNINKNAFENCSGLTSVTLGTGLTNIDRSAFKGCSSLTSIVIPDNVTSLSGSAFEGCSNLTNVIIGDGVTAIGGFQGCENLTDITIGANVTYVDDSVFTDSTSLTNIFVSDNNNTYKDINGNLYSKDGDIIVRYLTGKTDTDFTIPSSVATIAANAFENCSKLTEIVVPDSVTTIGSEAFTGCSNLTEITLPFVGATKDDETNVRLEHIFGYGYIPESLNKVTITAAERIGDYAFYACGSLTSVIIPDTVTSIGEGAFAECSGLTEIALPDGVTSIRDSAFRGCSGLTEIVIPEGITSISNYAFYWCSNLTSITIPDSVTSIGERAFEGCSSVTEIIIPANITSIGKYVFEECSNLTNVYYLGTEDNWNALNVAYLYNNTLIDNICYYAEEQPTKAGKYWHYNENGEIEIWESPVASEGLAYTLNEDGQSYSVSGIGSCTDTDIIIPAVYEGLPVTALSDNAFKEYAEVNSVVIPDSVTKIGKWAFRDCDNLNSVVIGNGVTIIDNQAFYGCGLISVEIGSSVESIGDLAFYGCGNLTSIIIPNSVTSIGNNAFAYCRRLVEVVNKSSAITITKGATDNGSLGQYALEVYNSSDTFNGTKLSNDSGYIIYTDGADKILVCYIGNETNLVLPSYITQINQQTFYYYQSRLTSIIIPESVISIGNYAFYGCGSLTNAYYLGTIGNLTIKANNTDLINNIYYYTESEPTEHGSFWHYVDGVPTVWDIILENTLEYALINGGTAYSVTGIGSYEGTDLIIPDTYGSNNLPVTTIADDAFYGGTDITSVTIGNNITNVGDDAFRNCTNLTDVYTNNIESWLKISFSNSYAHPNYYGQLHIVDSTGKDVKSLSIPSTVTSISGYALAHCSSLTSVTIPSSVTSIGTYAFWRCESLTSVTIPNSVTTINDRAFAYCTSLTSISIPASVTYVGAYAFDGCKDTGQTNSLTVYYVDKTGWSSQCNYSTQGSKRIWFSQTSSGGGGTSSSGTGLSQSDPVIVYAGSNSITLSGSSYKWFKFVPTTTKTYTITSSGSGDYKAVLYTGSTTSLSQLAQDDDSGGNLQFKITHTLNAGQTYFITVAKYNSSAAGALTLNIY
jgi:hypothetical protein